MGSLTSLITIPAPKGSALGRPLSAVGEDMSLVRDPPTRLKFLAAGVAHRIDLSGPNRFEPPERLAENRHCVDYPSAPADTRLSSSYRKWDRGALQSTVDRSRARRQAGQVWSPPSTRSTWPETWRPASVTKYATAWAMSSGRP